jgi:hypothetical protein
MASQGDGDAGGDVDVLGREARDREKATMHKANDPLRDSLFGPGAERSYQERQPAARETPRLVKGGDSAAGRAVAPAAAGEMGQAAEDDAGPVDGTPYQAFGRSRPYELPALLLYFNAMERRRYGRKMIRVHYDQIEGDDPMTGGFTPECGSFCFVVTTAGKRLGITVHGRELERGFHLFTWRKLPWMCSVERDFGNTPGEVITGIDIVELEEEK